MKNEHQPTATGDVLQKVTPGKWTNAQLMRAITFLENMALNLGSKVAEDVAAGLRVVILGQAPTIESCESCTGLSSKYSVLCHACAMRFGPMTPQKMIFQLEDPSDPDTIIWGACAFSTCFIPKVFGKDNTIAACEELLDHLNVEDDVANMEALLTAPGKEEIPQ